MRKLFYSWWLLAAPLLAGAAETSSPSIWMSFEQLFQNYVVAPLSSLLFFDLIFFDDDVTVPLVVVWLIAGSVYLTLKMRFMNVRGFSHAIAVTRGAYDHKGDPGEISHFQALSSALSATVGLGNIAGIALGITVGGPGAVFWIMVAGLLGMTSKFVECSLAVKYRAFDAQGRVLGGPMRYLSIGFAERGYPRLGLGLSAMFCILCIGGSLGGGNMFQSNQAYSVVAGLLPGLAGYSWAFGLVMACLVGVVIIGGIKRIGNAASIIVPFMCLIYVATCLFILAINYASLPDALLLIWNGAFTPEAGYGGFLGVMITGFRRASFSNEAGIGSAAIAHSAAATKEPIREGIVALLEPFIDTVVICAITGLTVVVTGAYSEAGLTGVMVASKAFGTLGSFMPWLLALTVLLFAYSTMISWCYYGERCWAYLFKTNNTLPFKLIFVTFTFFGTVFGLGPVLEFSDLMILGMAFPNLIGIIYFAPEVKRDLDDYWRRHKNSLRERGSTKAAGTVEASILSNPKA